MPSEAQGEPRIVVDESSFDFRGLGVTEIEDGLDQLNETLNALRDREVPTALAPMWDAVEVVDGCELIDYLSRSWPSGVSRDTLLLTSSLLGRCPEWSDTTANVPMESAIGGADPVQALSVGYALNRFAEGRAVGCLTFRHMLRQGLVTVVAADHAGDVFFFAGVELFKDFWRWRMRFEQVDESDFFSSCGIAFPGLRMHNELSFRRFDGSYAEIRNRVIEILGVLNDHFIDAYRNGNGISNEVRTALGQYHVDVSMESVKTRSSDKLMGLRYVQVDGEWYRCEWHAKLEPHRNRIHFWVPAPGDDDPILVGKFVVHLKT